MTKLTKTLLGISLIGFAAGGIVDFGGFNFTPAWTTALPLGAVFFALFIISLLLEKEMAKFDREQAAKPGIAPPEENRPASCRDCKTKNTKPEINYENQTSQTTG